MSAVNYAVKVMIPVPGSSGHQDLSVKEIVTNAAIKSSSMRPLAGTGKTDTLDVC
jgi:hypothetical protein